MEMATKHGIFTRYLPTNISPSYHFVKHFLQDYLTPFNMRNACKLSILNYRNDAIISKSSLIILYDFEWKLFGVSTGPCLFFYFGGIVATHFLFLLFPSKETLFQQSPSLERRWIICYWKGTMKKKSWQQWKAQETWAPVQRRERYSRKAICSFQKLVFIAIDTHYR